PIAARYARPDSAISRRWTSFVGDTCWRMFRPSWAPSTSFSARWTDERTAACRGPAGGGRVHAGEPRLGSGGGREISRGPAAKRGHPAVVAGGEAERRLAPRAGDPPCRRAARHGLHPCARGGDLLYHVQSRAGR